MMELAEEDFGDWRITFKPGWHLLLRSDSLEEKMESFLEVYSRTLKQKEATLVSVDARYDSSYAVKLSSGKIKMIFSFRNQVFLYLIPLRLYLNIMVAESQKQKIVGLDIGTNKVATIVAEVNEFQELEIIGIGTHASSGLKKGVVINIESTVNL